MSDSAYEEIMATAESVSAFLDTQTSPEAVALRARLVKCSALLEDLRISRGALATANANMAELYGELEEAKDAADAAAAAKTTFLATMSHELRTPMNGILGMLEVLATTPMTERQRNMLGVVRRSGVTLLELLNGVLDYSKIDAQKLELEQTDFDLRLLVEDVVTLMGAPARTKGVVVSYEIVAGSDTALRGDPARIRQILSNLIGNASKFTERGSITVKVAVVQDGAAGRRVVVDVADTGIGIAPEVIPRLFNVFTQADSSTTRRYGGTGLGLAIAAQLATLMGGSIRVESELFRGSVFHVELALQAAHAAPESRPRPSAEYRVATAARGSMRSRRVLLAEDNEVNRTVAVAMLEQLGCVVTVAVNGLDASAAVESNDFDAVFMDCQMPIMDGWEATHAIREWEARRSGRHVPIIALTANAYTQDRDACIDAGMDDFMTKPMSHLELADALSRWCSSPSLAPVAVQCAPPVVEVSEAEVLDRVVVDHLRAMRRPGRPDVLARAVESWSTSSVTEVAKLRAAVESGDLESGRRLSHTLRGGATSLGGKRFGALLGEIEKLARAGEGAAASQLLGGLDGERQAMLDALRALSAA